MIKDVRIQNFKSVKNLDINCKRVNLFLGESNTGKSNILEALSLFSLFIIPNYFKNLIRFENVTNLFYDDEIRNVIEVSLDNYSCRVLSPNESDKYFSLKLLDDMKLTKSSLDIYDDSISPISRSNFLNFNFPKKYLFKTFQNYTDDFKHYLLPAGGENLFEVIKSNKSLQKEISEIIKDTNLKFSPSPQGKSFHLIKEEDGTFNFYHFNNIGRKLQHLIFYLAVIESNKNSCILLDDFDSNLDTFFVELLVNKISQDKSNQYFIVLNNLETLDIFLKTIDENINIFYTYCENYKTVIKF